ncbi:MAG: hypothetical protein WD904_14650 [Dehalococcoidia bacterium]
MRFLLAAPLVCIGLLAACDDDGGSSSETPTSNFPAEARRLAPDTVLTAEDLPGFDLLDVTDLEGQAELSAECDIFDADVVLADSAATAESEAFTGPLDEQVLEHIAIYETADDAGAGLESTQDLRERCEDEFKDAVEQVAQNELDRLGIDIGVFGSIDVTIGGYDPPAAGDEIIGHRLNVDVDLVVTRQQYNLDVMVVRVGRVVAALLYGRFGEVNPEAEGLLLERVTDKLSATDEALPE